MNHIYQKNEKYVSIDTFKYILKLIKPVALPIYSSPKNINFETNTSVYYYLEDGARFIKLTTRFVKPVDGSITGDWVDKVEFAGLRRKEKYVCTWIADKSGEDKKRNIVTPSSVLRKFNKVYKPLDIIKEDKERLKSNKTTLFDYKQEDDKLRLIQSAKPLIGYNTKFDKTSNYVYEYDLNSAYAVCLKNKIIDTYNYRTNDVVHKNEVGFILDINLTMVTQHNIICDYVFPLIESPYKDLVTELYEVKKNAPKDSIERTAAKQSLTFIVGLWQNHNPFLRAYVVNTCNAFINNILKKHKNEITLWNTDAVYSINKLPELEIGDNIGQFKIAYEGQMQQVGTNYKLVDANEIHIKGKTILKDSIENEQDLLSGNIKATEMAYKFDYEKEEIIKNEKK